MDATREISRDLAPLLSGEVFTDEVHRILYSSAACMYEIKPLAVVHPKDKHDVSLVLEYCYRNSLPVTARGAGSGISGQAIGSGVIIDLTRYMNRILSVDEENLTARVQPGVVLSQLNGRLKGSGLFFPPDPSSADYCTLGGMIANNSSGARSLKYGATKDYVDSLEVVLSDGEIVDLRRLPVGSDELKELRQREDHLGAIYTSMIGLLWRNRELVNQYSPDVEKNSSGYNLREAFRDGAVDLTKIIAGSEGTLGVVTEATLKLSEFPPERCALILFFDDMYKAGRSVLEARRLEPAAIEFANEGFLKAARGVDREVDTLVPEGSKAMLLVEFDGDDSRDLERKASGLAHRLVKELALSTRSEIARDEEQAQRLWRVRKTAVPIVMKTQERKRAIPFIEDMVVPPEKLPEFLERLYAILEEYSVDAPAYGHAGEGNIHIRPLLDLTCDEDVKTMEALARDVYALTGDVRGSLSGEHGDGLVRAPFLKESAGPLYELLFWTKRIFDPKGILNPGKKISDYPQMSQNLKLGPDYEELPTGMGFDEERFVREIEICHGCGMCRSLIDTTMCPVYRALKDEKYTPRAKANLLRAMVSGKIDADELVKEAEFREIITMCFGCNMCAAECPTEVNMPLLVTIAKHEILRKSGISFPSRIFCNFERVGRMAAAFGPLSNILMRLSPVRIIMERLTGLSRRRRMPAFNLGRFRPHRNSRLLHGASKVVYFPGCFVNFMDAKLGQSLATILERADLEVVIPDVGCCGVPSISHGDLAGARIRAERNIASLREFAACGVPIVTTCPSCALALKRSYVELFGGEDAQLVAGAVREATDFLMDLVKEGRLSLDRIDDFPQAAYHSPCHLRVLLPELDRIGDLNERIGVDLKPIEDSCCGIGGTFGFKSKNMTLSEEIGSTLFESIMGTNASVVITECPTCKIQISQGTGLKVVHPVELLERASDHEVSSRTGTPETDILQSKRTPE